MLKNIKAIIFDYDGTVADSLDTISNAVNSARARLGREPLSKEEIKGGINFGARALTRTCVLKEDERRSDESYLDTVFGMYLEVYAKACAQKTDRLYDGIAETLASLKKRGYRLALLSNKPHNLLVYLSGFLFEKDTFDVIRGPLPGGLAKPDKRLTLEVLSRISSDIKPSECAIVGDSDVDVRTAINAGMTPVSVSWGLRSAEFLKENGATLIVDSPAELDALFE